ncbi:unnamed protein product [Orchesella dallaii]|uniref:Uncharacterized protein n=1 Tax=Orchesella dallaii TaxID=48710 RepID=A0ABP1R6Z2_9HEXA
MFTRFMESLLVCGSSLAVVLMKTHVQLHNGLENYIILNARNAFSLFCFTRSCEDVDLNEINVGVVALSLLGWATTFAGHLLEQIARDGIILSAMLLNKSANAFHFKRRVDDSASDDDANAIGAKILSDYKWIKRISKHVNSAFNIVFRFFLLSNVFMFAVFFDEWFNPKVGKWKKIFKLVNVVSVCITFYYANQTAKTVSENRLLFTKN